MRWRTDNIKKLNEASKSNNLPAVASTETANAVKIAAITLSCICDNFDDCECKGRAFVDSCWMTFKQFGSPLYSTTGQVTTR